MRNSNLYPKAALFAAIDVSLLVFFKSVSSEQYPGNICIFLMYLSLLLSCFSAISALDLVTELGLLPFDSSIRRMDRTPTTNQYGRRSQGTPVKLLNRYGTSSSLKWLIAYWYTTTISSMLCPLVAVIIYMAKNETAWMTVMHNDSVNVETIAVAVDQAEEMQPERSFTQCGAQSSSLVLGSHDHDIPRELYVTVCM
ncbi:uncharacterized protein STEHIDRAFT_114163 [Stereum hirsutum FP-91666 SS1]|uniref:uncharacterized protein n=1 Tax=Stereum hirsutum (strain FP-91666) TaxID=721885 RepID=UPI0004449F05|nr:uncharacterized protein STEHIDRAFT_114163 [Stereum hirsutum FP-91666 SS1]EIM82200.1 hypothetical protein STEHIDRAFT_114163 [Stereum hirsutum FP-91666 SS1]